MNLKKLFIFSAICTLAFVTNVSADTKKTCENYTAEEYNYIVKNTDPVDLDTTCSNGTLYTDEYLLQLENELDKSLIKILRSSKLPHISALLFPTSSHIT